MKKIIFIFALLFLVNLSSKAQPNKGFEDWTTQFSYEIPDKWQTLNFLAALSPPNPVSVTKAIGFDTHSGNFALKLKTIYVNNNPAPGPALIYDTMGGIFTGKINPSPFSYNYGFPFTDRPAKLELWYKYAPIGNDTGGVAVVMTKWNGFSRDTVSLDLTNIYASSTYSLLEINLSYVSATEQPDTAVIALLSSKNRFIARVNSTLYVDDLLFTGWVGINESSKAGETAKVKVFPNPASDNIIITTQILDADNIRIVDVSGKCMGTNKILNCSVNVNTSLFVSGIYFYEIGDKKNRILNKGKFNVIR
jgi:hypothetical protein